MIINYTCCNKLVLLVNVITAFTKLYIPPRPWRYRSLVNSAITVTNVWKTMQRYFIVYFQFEKTLVLFSPPVRKQNSGHGVPTTTGLHYTSLFEICLPNDTGAYPKTLGTF
jgi:hypothetical protein